MLNRRNLFLLVPAVFSFSCSNNNQEDVQSNLSALLNELTDNQWTIQMGEQLYQESANTYELPINEIFNQHFSLPESLSLDEFKMSIYDQIVSDYENDMITQFEGWVFSKTETLLYVLAYKYSG